MNNINEMLDILAISETNGRITLEDIMEKFSCSKRTAYRRVKEFMQLLPVERDEYKKSYKIINKNSFTAENNDLIITFIIFSLLISYAQGDTKVMLQKAYDDLKNALNTNNTKNI